MINKIGKKPLMIILIFILIVIDQYIKIYINNNIMNINFYFINNIIGFNPHINKFYSWIGSLLHLKVNILPYIIINTILLFLIIMFYNFLGQKNKLDKIVNTSYIFLISGTVCSLIDKIFWGGSLDYINLEGFFIFDLKDVYITIFEIIVIFCFIFNYKGFRKLDEKLLCYELKAFVKSRYFSKWNK